MNHLLLLHMDQRAFAQNSTDESLHQSRLISLSRMGAEYTSITGVGQQPREGVVKSEAPLLSEKVALFSMQASRLNARDLIDIISCQRRSI